MLPRAWRMRDGATFASTIRRGRKNTVGSLVIYRLPADSTSIGFIVSKAVGSAVVRNRVKRQLRHVFIDVGMQKLADTAAPLSSNPLAGADPGFGRVVVRVLPQAAGRHRRELERDVRTGLGLEKGAAA